MILHGHRLPICEILVDLILILVVLILILARFSRHLPKFSNIDHLGGGGEDRGFVWMIRVMK